MRDPISVDEFFFFAGIPEDELKRVFHYDPDNMPREVSYADGYFGFMVDGKQRLADLVQKPIAFVQLWQSGRRGGSWNMGSKRVLVPFEEGEVGI